jgi:hypothetical protein
MRMDVVEEILTSMQLMLLRFWDGDVIRLGAGGAILDSE